MRAPLASWRLLQAASATRQGARDRAVPRDSWLTRDHGFFRNHPRHNQTPLLYVRLSSLTGPTFSQAGKPDVQGRSLILSRVVLIALLAKCP